MRPSTSIDHSLMLAAAALHYFLRRPLLTPSGREFCHFSGVNRISYRLTRTNSDIFHFHNLFTTLPNSEFSGRCYFLSPSLHMLPSIHSQYSGTATSLIYKGMYFTRNKYIDLANGFICDNLYFGESLIFPTLHKRMDFGEDF
jgi:hypothetical protein